MGNRYIPLEERFWSRVRKTPGCWIWEGFSHRGYGRICAFGRQYKAHRISWFLHKGYMPPSNVFVCHSCDNPSCVNPDHLWIGTSADNNRDRHNKGRSAITCGSDQYRSKFTEDDVKLIRSLAWDGHTFYDLSKRFNVHKETIGKIARGKSWRHVTDPPPVPPREPKYHRGDGHHKSRLTEADVRKIYQLRANGLLIKDIASRYGASTSCIDGIVSGRNWKHLYRESLLHETADQTAGGE